MKTKSILTHLKTNASALCIAILGAMPIGAIANSNITMNYAEGMYVLKASNTTVKSVFDYIEKHSSYVFVYNQTVNSILNNKVNINLQGRNVKAILADVCARNKLNYRISGRQVIITKSTDSNPTFTSVKKDQTKRIKGTVSDETGEPLMGATVKIKNSDAGVVTDMDGNFAIEASIGSDMEISYIGFTDQTIKIGSRDNYTVTMSEDNNTLDELVVIGYGTVKKKDLTGAISAVKGEDIATRHTTSLSSALQGSMSGVMVTRDNNAPGAGASAIRVRGITTIGESSPLVIVDGVESTLDYVNPNDVESISVLKDAAAASIYGSKAAAGVILVTTKRGSDTGKMNMHYDAELGWEIPTKQPSMVGVTRYLEMNNELQYNDNPTGGFSQVYTADQTKNWIKYNATDPNNYPNTNWSDMILKDSAPRMTHTLSLSGGNKNIRSLTTLSYDDVKGLIYGRRYQRYMLRSNNDYTISKTLGANLDINIRHAKSSAQNYSPFSDLRKMPAIYPATWADGRIASGKSGTNPYGLLMNGGSNVSHSTQIAGKGSLTYTPIKGMSLQAIIAPYINFQKSKSFRLACWYTLADDPETIGGYLDAGGLYSTNKLTEGRNDDWHVTSQLLANYMFKLGQHDFTLMGGFENYVTKNDNLSASRDQYELTEFPYLNVGPDDYKDNSGTGSEYTSNSFFGRLLYSYADKYLFQANIRHDGSSRFAKKYRWGTFPSFSAGWVATEEPFMKKKSITKWLSYLKLRASWGKLGNERIGSNYFPYLALMSFGNSYFYMADGSVISGKTARPGVLAVEDITWETTTSTDLGIDAHFLDNRLTLSFDYYWKKTTDMLLPIEIPYTMGYSNPNTNAGKMSTHGFDIDFGWQDHIADFNYSVELNLSDFLSKIDYLNNSDIISGGKIKRAGVLFDEYYGYICDGIYQTQDEINNSAVLNSSVTVGDLKYRDISGPNGVPDGKISPEYDRVPLGNSLPRYQYGGQINASWHDLDLSVAFQGIGKQNSYLSTPMVQPLRDNYGNIPSIIDGKYWSVFNTNEENLHAAYPRLSNVSKSNNYATSSFWIFNGRYFRLKNVTLGYTLPKAWTKVINLDTIRFYISSSDLFCISKYPSGWDPEMGASSYPITTSLLFGIQVNF